jgi:hypothetical protein
MSAEPHTEWLEVINNILTAQERDGITLDQLYQLLQDQGTPIPTRELRKLITGMVERGEVVAQERQSGKGRPSKFYVLDKFDVQESLFDFSRVATCESSRMNTLPREEVAQLKEEQGYLADIVLDHFNRDELVKEIRKAVPKLVNEDPIDLILGYTQTVVGHLQALRKEMIDKRSRSDREGFNTASSQFEFCKQASRAYLTQLLGLNRGVTDDDRVFDVAEIEKVQDPRLEDKQVIFFDPIKARTELEKRIFGRKFLEEYDDLNDFDTNNLTGLVSAATDASVIPFEVKVRPLGSYEVPETVQIFTGAAAQIQTITDQVFPALYDYDFDSGFLSTRNEFQAAEQGWMLTEFTINLMGESLAPYAKSASQDFRQYRRDNDVLLNRISWKSTPGMESKKIDVLVRDGRLFPSVHRLDDYERDGLYGRLVRGQMQEFATVCRRAIDEYDYVVYSGAVKQPAAYMLAPLVFWYCRYKLGMKDHVQERHMYRAPLGDTLLSFIILGTHAKSLNKRPKSFLSTFRVIRRFSDLGVPEEVARYREENETAWHGIDEDSREDWLKYVAHRRREKQRRYEDRADSAGPLPEREYSDPIFLFQRVGVLMGFALPLDGRFERAPLLRLPRFEVMVDMQRKDEIDPQFRKLLASLTTPESLVPDDDHNFGNWQSIPSIIPVSSREAHRAAQMANERYSRHLEERLIETVATVEKMLRRARNP